MKTLKIIAMLVMLLALAISTGLTASAVGPADVTSPTAAPYADSQAHVIGANTSQWFRLVYGGDHSQMTIRMPNGAAEGLKFELYTPQEMDTWWDTSPIGAGSPEKDDLVWTGNSHVPGAYDIKVTNPNPYAVNYQLAIDGESVNLGPTTSLAVPASTSAVVSAVNTEPQRALPVDASSQVIPANTTLWYSFSYPGDHSQVTLTVLNGADNRLRFQVHTPSQIRSWWEVDPIGWGSVKGSDLVWSGNAHEGGTWYVEMINPNSYPVAFAITHQ